MAQQNKISDQNPHRVLVFGSQGGLGSTFMRFFAEKNISAQGLSHAEADITQTSQIRETILHVKPTLVINASGYTAVDAAETEKDKAFAVNARGVGTLAEACRDTGATFLTFSSDYVFSGEKRSRPWTEEDQTKPSSVYGTSKLEGEKLALKYPRSLVLRTSWLYSDTGKSFPKTILAKAKAGEPLKIVDDQVAAPTYAPGLVQASMKLLEKNCSGLFQFSDAGETNWFEFASAAIKIYGQQTGTPLASPQPIKTADLKLKAPRPTYSLLDSQKALRMGILQRPWHAALEDFIRVGLNTGNL